MVPVRAPAPYGPAPAPRITSAPPMSSYGNWVQITQPPKGSLSGIPSSITRARPAPEGAIARSETPCVVALALLLTVRRKSDNPGTCSSASSRRSDVESCSVSRVTLEKAGLPTASGSRAPVTITCSTVCCAAAGAPQICDSSAVTATAAAARRRPICSGIMTSPPCTPSTDPQLTLSSAPQGGTHEIDHPRSRGHRHLGYGGNG